MSLLLDCYRRTPFLAGAIADGSRAHGPDGIAAIAKGTRRLRGQVRRTLPRAMQSYDIVSCFIVWMVVWC
jgi:hypothetical protein